MENHVRKSQKIFTSAFLAFLLSLSGCAEDAKTTSSTTTTTSATDMCTAPVTSVVDYGERATSGTGMGLRGAFSDIALIPGSGYPGFVYTDAGSVSLKYRFWNGSNYVTETIAGGLSTNFVRLVYLSTGKPLVFWANGATAIYMAARSTASTTDAGTWTVTAIENVATMTTRSVEAAVSPSNQVAVFYINGAGTTARILLCPSNCDTAANYTGMGVVGNAINATASASANSSDVKWCNAGGGVYYPYVAFTGTANSMIARCTNSTLSSCLVPANWSSTAITDGTNATGANQFFSKLDIASAANSAFNVVARRSTSNEIRAYTQNAGGCATGALAFSATSRLIGSGATLANAYGNLSRDSAGRWHLVVNDSTTNIRYFNELTGTVTNAWNALANIETTTIGAAGATRGGLAIDETGDQVLVTYGRTTGGTPTQTLGNLVLASNNCASGGAGCASTTVASSSAAAGMTWQNTVEDTTGQISLVTGQFPKTISINATSAGRPAVAYIDFSAGTNTTGRLKYAYRTGTSSTDTWVTQDIGGFAASPQSVSFAFDSNDRPWIAFYDNSSFRYYLITNASADGSNIWASYQFPIAAAAAATLPASNNVSLAMSYAGGVGRPLLIVSNSGSATKVIRSAIFDLKTETWLNNTQLDTGTSNFGDISVHYDKNGVVALGYYDTTNAAVKYTASIDAGVTWATAASVITGSGGMGITLRLNPSTGKPTLAFYDRSLNFVRVKSCTAAPASCTTAASWTNIGLGVVDAMAGVSGLSAAATDGLLNATLSFTSDGQAWVVYPTGAGAATSSDLMFSYVSSLTPVFVVPAPLAAGSNANVSTPVAATAANFATGGWMPSSVRTSLGSMHTAYVGQGNFLYVTSCGN